MSVLVNGQLRALPASSTLAALFLALSPQGPFAVAHNGEFVPRTGYAECCLNHGDIIDIVNPTVGG